MVRKAPQKNISLTRQLSIRVSKKKNIAVIGGGIFGIFSALKLAERGYTVTIFEKSSDILTGASYLNQNRLHMGYHYPRSEETATVSNVHQKAFVRMFERVIVDDFDHYYCIAKEGSKTSSQEYLAFCNKVGIPYIKEFPEEITINKDMVSLSIKVPEKIYDATLLRKTLREMLEQDKGISLHLNTEAINLTIRDDGLTIDSKHKNRTTSKKFDAVLNATYSNMNEILIKAGVPVKEYQYELCEVPVVKVSWGKRVGCGIMDGPFFGILPLGFAEEYLLYDVELSVLERSFGILPKFAHSVSHYDSEKVRQKRFARYINKAKKYIVEMEHCTYLYSFYVVRMILPNRDHDDARPTEVFRHGQGLWSIFAGKISAAIPASDKIVEEVENYFNGEKKV